MSSRRPFKEVEASRPKFDSGYKHVYTQVPQPDFKPGGGLNDLAQSEDFKPENAKWRSIDPTKHEKPQLYKLMISAVTPRPIALVSSTSPDGTSNLAPFSYFNMVSHNPPTIMVSIQANSKNPSGLKDSAFNIRETKEFCVSIISETFLEAANITSTDTPAEIEEWTLAGLTKRKSETVRPPHVAESAFSMECTLQHWYEVRTDEGVLSNTVILGRVRRFHAKEFVFDPEDPMKILPEKLRPVSRLGGITYGRTLQFSEVPRPSWDQVKDEEVFKAAVANGSKTVD